MEDHYKDLDAELLLARKWPCQLNFHINEDGETIDLLHYTQYHPESDDINFPLSKNYPRGCSYQFDPIKYNAIEPSCMAELFKDLCDAAINSGYMLTRKKRTQINVTCYKCSYNFYCSRYFKTDGRTIFFLIQMT